MSGFLFNSCNYVIPYTCASIHQMGENTRCSQCYDILQKLRASVCNYNDSGALQLFFRFICETSIHTCRIRAIPV